MNPTDTQQSMLAKVRKLLAKAEDLATTTEEAELYTAKAADLIAAYGIDAALLASQGAGPDPVGDTILAMDAPYAVDKAELLSTIAGQLRCRAVLRTHRGHHGRRLDVHLFGHGSDLERTELLFTSLLLQTATALARTPVPRREHPAAFRRSWLAGFRVAIGERLSRAERGAETTAGPRFAAAHTTAALVLADRTEAVESALQAAYPSLRTGRGRQLSGSGMSQGWAAAQQADLGGTRLAGGRARLDPG